MKLVTSFRTTCWLILLLVVSTSGRAADDAPAKLAEDLRPWLSCLSGQASEFSLTGTVTAKIDGKMQNIAVRLERFDDEASISN